MRVASYSAADAQAHKSIRNYYVHCLVNCMCDTQYSCTHIHTTNALHAPVESSVAAFEKRDCSTTRTAAQTLQQHTSTARQVRQSRDYQSG